VSRAIPPIVSSRAFRRAAVLVVGISLVSGGTALAAEPQTNYTYDGDGLRTLASTGSQNNKKTQYDWDPNAPLAQLAAERNGAGSLLRRYRRGLDTVMLDTGGNPFYFHYDGLGSVVNLTNSTGVTQWTYSYLPYGGVRTETKNQNQAPDNVLRFTGEVLDPTGLYQLRARSYDPSTGRFVSLDPVAPGPTDPYVSAYAYVNGNPIRYTDPSGRCLGPLTFLAPICVAASEALGAAGASAVGGAAIGAATYGVVTTISNVALRRGRPSSASRSIQGRELGRPRPRCSRRGSRRSRRLGADLGAPRQPSSLPARSLARSMEVWLHLDRPWLRTSSSRRRLATRAPVARVRLGND
jgi:RHS repeat-associated protein